MAYGTLWGWCWSQKPHKMKMHQQNRGAISFQVARIKLDCNCYNYYSIQCEKLILICGMWMLRESLRESLILVEFAALRNQLKSLVLVYFIVLQRIRHTKIDAIHVQCPFKGQWFPEASDGALSFYHHMRSCQFNQHFF